MRSLGGAVAQNSNRINFVPRITSKHGGSHFWIHPSTSLLDNLSITGNISLPPSCSSSPSLHANSLMLIWQVGLHQNTLPSAPPNEAAFLKRKLDLYLVAVWYVSATCYIGRETVRQAERQRERIKCPVIIVGCNWVNPTGAIAAVMIETGLKDMPRLIDLWY